jgi:hypothetical protein
MYKMLFVFCLDLCNILVGRAQVVNRYSRLDNKSVLQFNCVKDLDTQITFQVWAYPKEVKFTSLFTNKLN